MSTVEKGKEANIFNLVISNRFKWKEESTQSRKKSLIYVNENNFSLKFFSFFIVSNNEIAAAIFENEMRKIFFKHSFFEE